MLRQTIANIVIAGFLLLFAITNLKAFCATGDMAYLLVAINEGVWVLLYLVRERATSTSDSKIDWAVAFSATFVGTLLRPAFPVAIGLGNVLIIAGIIGSIASVIFLNRSVAIIPAVRSIKTSGPYRLIRHPLYLTELMTLIGYLLINISLANILIAICDTALMLVRIHREELFLSQSESYQKYRERTPWKLVPFIY